MTPPKKDKYGPPIIGVSENIRRIREVINHVADTGLNVVITGESGVGKEVVAQNLYRQSPRFGKPFLKINCAALPEGLLESELFGHEQGAFTGADRKKRGKFELANGGVLLLDEIGDMSLPLQAKLLHVLQSGEFSPLGSEKEIRTDTWVIAATNQELEREIREDRFREDLYYRLNIIKIQISPLRERPEDIPPLIDFFVQDFAGQFGNHRIVRPNAYIIDRLCEYSWPGNVRELQNILKRALALGNWEEILSELFDKSRNAPARSRYTMAAGNGFSIRDFVKFSEDGNIDLNALALKEVTRSVQDKVEREVIRHVLDRTGWNRSRASKILKISYKALLYKIKDLGIEAPPEF
ncbi:MAG: sigma-54 interaction domain-containing protein [Desulfobacterales bacterium]